MGWNMAKRAFIFECNEHTQGDCLGLQLFGTQEPWALRVRVDDFCFLYKHTPGGNHLLYGVWVAQSGCACHEPKAWGGQYCNQVRVERVSQELLAVPRWSVRHIVENAIGGPLRVKHVLDCDRAQSLLQYYASDFNLRARSGLETSLDDQLYHERYPRKEEFRCADGHTVRSLSEMAIDNFLSGLGIRHDYEYLLPLPEQLVPDFTVYTAQKRPIYVEFWGVMDDPDFVARKTRKMEIYARHRLSPIELWRGDLTDLNHSLLPKLRERGIDVLL